MKTGALACLALCSNMTAICSNTYVYVGFTIFALCDHGVVLIVEATRFLSATGVGLLISVAVRLLARGLLVLSWGPTCQLIAAISNTAAYVCVPIYALC